MRSMFNRFASGASGKPVRVVYETETGKLRDLKTGIEVSLLEGEPTQENLLRQMYIEGVVGIKPATVSRNSETGQLVLNQGR